MGKRTFEMSPLAPFSLEFTAWALRRRSKNEVDRWDGSTYRRLIGLRGQAVEVCVRDVGCTEASRLEVSATGSQLDAKAELEIRTLLTHMLGLRVDLRPFYRMASREPRLRPLAEHYRGLKPVRFPTMFETLINAIACQQFTISAGLQLLNRLARKGSVALKTRAGKVFGFPDPSDLSCLSARTFRGLGFSGQKTRACRDLSRGLVDKHIDLERLPGCSNEEAIDFLQRLPGIGRWTAEYALLRGLGRLDVFPGDDVGARKGLAAWLHRSVPMDYAGVRRVVGRWQPYSGFIYFHLLMESLTAAGELHAARS